MTRRPIRVLVVEDDDQIQAAIAEVLDEEGYVVDVASNGAVALDCARRILPDVVLLDLNLPIMDGWQFRDALRTLEGGDVPQIIIMTADYAASAKAQRIGACGYLAKPFDIDDMLALVSTVTQKV